MNLTENQIFLDRYLVKETIGFGSFGKVFKIDHLHKPKSYALKIDIAQKGNVFLESRTLSDLQGLHGIPKLYKHGIDENFSYMVMELLGFNLSKLLKDHKGKLSLCTVIECTKQILQRIESVHKKGYLHRDLKPQQILLGQNKKTLYLTDFGLSRRYEVNTYHISFQNSCPRVGNATFSSLNNHSGVRQSRRDDLESIAYIAFYLYKGHLPWQCDKKLTSSSKWQATFQVKSNCKVEDLCQYCPKEFGIFLNYTRNLKFEEKPDYSYCISLFETIATREGLNSARLDWNPVENLTIGSKSLSLESRRALDKTEKTHLRRKKVVRSKTLFGKCRKLPERGEVVNGLSCLKKFVFDESTYNSLELTPKNVLPEFKNRKNFLKENSETVCRLM